MSHARHYVIWQEFQIKQIIYADSIVFDDLTCFAVSFFCYSPFSLQKKKLKKQISIFTSANTMKFFSHFFWVGTSLGRANCFIAIHNYIYFFCIFFIFPSHIPKRRSKRRKFFTKDDRSEIGEHFIFVFGLQFFYSIIFFQFIIGFVEKSFPSTKT